MILAIPASQTFRLRKSTSEYFIVDYDGNVRTLWLCPDPGDLEVSLRAYQGGLFVHNVFARGERE